MRRGETVTLAVIGVVVAGLIARNVISLHTQPPDPGIPFYSTADPALLREAGDLYRENDCRQCHSLWTVKSVFESVPAPALDGIGALRREEWLYPYFYARRSPGHIAEPVAARISHALPRRAAGGAEASARKIHGEPESERLVSREHAGRRI
jgi:sulfur-oxidizing protein SoxX